ncbi:carbohydrate ABC transporter ATP-binding protein, CUT1 family [Tistlia consotensis]|uniref:Carbohydrate ABC transporter ATP-binding protein, CUT1 family n=1 Tax=Tistlia consotensis USBA 355 TaxID=560819 RepID=A0A1Y6BWG4_9PROT|nr:ABC transporter ATP-binding protein [Tistlia consotensis]SMF21904.1 carbohydrate ABC transporter ATP-binding protein, CUT1 family [Tistlia consotensis USBA 355]SNR46458.1 carbohydrate ABC transporter ATP-binding protein, CUT1 family [Tistlia consotensis]
MADLTLDSVTKIYRPRGREPVRAVSGLDMAIADGEIVALLGSSGCGKTSTLRMVAGFETVSEGSISLGGRRLNALRPAQRNVAMAFEGYSLYPPLTVRDNVAFALLRERAPRAEVASKVAEVAELLEIEGSLDRYPATISSGHQQRASLARALIRPAALHLLDEPMSQLEPQVRAVLRARIKEWLKDRGMTAVLVTHDQTDAIALADRIAVMEASRLMQFGTPAELRERPANLFVAGFVGEPPMNLVEAEVVAGDGRPRVVAADGLLTLELPALNGPLAPRPGQRVWLGLSPRHLAVGRGPQRARVVANQWLGDQTHLALELGDGAAALPLIAVAAGMLEAEPGESVAFEVEPRGLHLFDHEDDTALYHGSPDGTTGEPA